MSIQRLMRPIGPPPSGKGHKYYLGWRSTIANWWTFYKPKRGVYKHSAMADHWKSKLKKMPLVRAPLEG